MNKTNELLRDTAAIYKRVASVVVNVFHDADDAVRRKSEKRGAEQSEPEQDERP